MASTERKRTEERSSSTQNILSYFVIGSNSDRVHEPVNQQVATNNGLN